MLVSMPPSVALSVSASDDPEAPEVDSHPGGDDHGDDGDPAPHRALGHGEHDQCDQPPVSRTIPADTIAFAHGS